MALNEIRHRAHLIQELGDVPKIPASHGKLCQVVTNLLMNAAQAIPEG
jgi:nitrogen-specific signal transduction histidine kinase